jgi:hypothetical protein
MLIWGLQVSLTFRDFFKSLSIDWFDIQIRQVYTHEGVEDVRAEMRVYICR